MENFQIAMVAGYIEDHLLFGHYEPENNHGFDRSVAMFGSTDPERMQAFFESEFERRNGTQEDIEEAQRRFDSLFGRFPQEPTECVSPFEGLIDGTLQWNGDAARQIYILEADAPAPIFLQIFIFQRGLFGLYSLMLMVLQWNLVQSHLVVPEGAKQCWPKRCE